MKTDPENWYNSERKLRYLQGVSGDARGRIIRSVFSEFSKTEYKFGMDMSEFEQKNFYDYYNKGRNLRYDSIARVDTAICDYRNWCANQGFLVNENAMKSAIDVYSVSAISTMFGSPSHLLNSLNTVFSHTSQNGIEYIYRTYFWLAFMGFRIEEAFQIRSENVHIANGVISYNGIDRKIFSQSIPDIQMASSLQSLPVDMKRYTTMRDRVSGSYILRGLAKNDDSRFDPENTMVYRPVISRAVNAARKIAETKGEPISSKRYNINLTYTNVRLSGIFYDARMHEKNGEDIKLYFRGLADQDIGFNRDADMPKEEYSKRLVVEMTTVKKYMDDYKRWKAAFL